MDKLIENKRINQVIQEVEEAYFFGRNDEIKLFQNLIQKEYPEFKVINLYGKGGIGKTYLLYEFAIIAGKENIPFIHLDTQDFNHTIDDFTDYLHSMLATHLHIDNTNPKSIQDCIEQINDFEKKIFIVVDTYEQMDNLDRWFRNVFIRKLSPRVSIILAGRKELTGEWQESPAWRKITKQIELTSFSFDDTKRFLQSNGITNESTIKKIWEFTNGHPLLLSLATISDVVDVETINIFKNNAEALSTLTRRWLSEVKDESLIKFIEIAALLRHFDQYTISQILNYEIPTNTFHELVSLSFIQKTKVGWTIHELVRDAISIELKQRNHDRYLFLTNKIIQFYYTRIITQPSKEDIASFFYHIGDDVIQSVFFQDDSSMDTTMYLEPIDEYNFHEVEDFFTYLNNNLTVSKTNFYNRSTNLSFQFDASLEHNQLEQELIGPSYIQKMGYDGASLLKKDGEVIGISINVPINKQTLPFLENEPVSRAYFANLSEVERNYYNVPVEKSAGYFIRYQEYKDPTDNAARGFLLYSLLPFVFSGGILVVSTPLKLFQELLYKFGFQTVDGASHDDYLMKQPTPTFLLDLSGPRLIPYLKQFIAGITTLSKMDILTEEFSLTSREQDIIKLLLEDKPIIEIANELYIAEITVKKALSRIYQKANVKNRMQLMTRIWRLFRIT
ncbi:LuxR C-terminal-related transcriptional regulator [Paucisalibacillus globulus]|uniref:LuxR C-terminal-related transcriptional regulator n=1 Tax=Paucisalibacillus globulus TaxID=351095 RepID=UPI00040DBADF|nr:LuxR C-terminal-related transcriptional regulator [Paucisalibacillus globulus]